MKSLQQICLVALLVLAFATACRHETANTNQSNVSGPAAAVQTTIYHGVVVVESINAERPSIEIDHEDIKDLIIKSGISVRHGGHPSASPSKL